MFDVYCLVSAV